MNIKPYENPLKAQEVAATSLDDFLERIQNIVTTGGYRFLIQKSQLEKMTGLMLNQAIANSQNFVVSGLIQLREEIHSHVGQNQEDLKKGLYRFSEMFSEYQHTLSQDMKSLAAQLALNQSNQEAANLKRDS